MSSPTTPCGGSSSIVNGTCENPANSAGAMIMGAPTARSLRSPHRLSVLRLPPRTCVPQTPVTASTGFCVRHIDRRICIACSTNSFGKIRGNMPPLVDVVWYPYGPERFHWRPFRSAERLTSRSGDSVTTRLTNHARDATPSGLRLHLGNVVQSQIATAVPDGTHRHRWFRSVVP